jgi:short-subunit dehydrogenase
MKQIKTLVITGSGDGLGREIAIKASQNYKIICLSKSDNVFDTYDLIKPKSPNSYAIKVDISDLNETTKKIQSLKLNNEPIGFILCAATLGQEGGIEKTNLNLWKNVFETNIIGNLNVIKSFLPQIKSSKHAKIIFFSGGGAAYGYPKFSSYSLSKTATVRAAENLHLELLKYGDITCLAVAPGAMETKMLEKVKKSGADIKTTVPITETRDFILKLIHEEISYLSGKFIHVRDNIFEYNSSNIDKNRWMLRRNE